MIRYVSKCVGCPPEMGCIYESCPYYKVPIHDCDKCGGEDCAKYIIDNLELCEKCAEEWFEDYYSNLDKTTKIKCEEYSDEFFDKSFGELNISEKAEAVDINIKIIE